ncbi:SEL1-like repeat protein [Mariprofundus sp. EBB-1]|uniref:SEL1-like repeat protein n=1 Tax=Mariprofundus sp. EBB-1 TaxID=2650971 RepID=UPI0011C4106C|nr:SEL1-like repeat protein [Mariprofundus sp. EBB-1]
MSSINAVAAVDAQECLQSYYMKSYARALPLCKAAAQAENEQAQFVLGMMYAKGNGVQRDFQKASRWLTAASQQGHLAARYKLQNLEHSLSEQARKKQISSFWTDHKPISPQQKNKEKIAKTTIEKAPVPAPAAAKKQPLQIETFAEPLALQPAKQYAPVNPAKRPAVLTHAQPTGVKPVKLEPAEIKIIESKAPPVQAQEKPAHVGITEDFSKSWPEYEGLNRSETAEIGETMASDMAEEQGKR